MRAVPPPLPPAPCCFSHAAFASFWRFFHLISSNMSIPGGGFLFQGGPYSEEPAFVAVGDDGTEVAGRLDAGNVPPKG